jgi:predicted restriction endonuclease
MQKEDIEYILERACLRKANLNEETANQIVDKALQKDNKLLYYYRCQFCNSIHLTSQVPDNSRHQLEVI